MITWRRSGQLEILFQGTTVLAAVCTVPQGGVYREHRGSGAEAETPELLKVMVERRVGVRAEEPTR